MDGERSEDISRNVGAAALIAFLAAVSPTIDNFWADEDPAARQQDMIHFAKNMALAGGALALSAVEEPWPASVGQPTAASRVKTTWRVVAA